MTDAQTIQPASLDVRPIKRPLWQRISIVWLVPLLALCISIGVAFSSYANRGILIEISFENASGVTADETVIKYRDVTVGRVEKVEFSLGLSDVLVYARIDKTVAPYLDDDAQFWVVRPDVSLRGITGLDTVLSGVHIKGSWDNDADVAQSQFLGLETPPQTRVGQRGTVISLRARDGSALSQGAPILHKGITVGNLGTPILSFNGNDVIVDAFVHYPYDQRITSNTRFWDTSGFSLSLGTGGVSINVNSIASLIEGGIAFDTIVSGGRPVRDSQVFDLFFDEEAARNSQFSSPVQNAALLNVDVLFDSSVRGLSAGSEVRFQGVRIGTVTNLSAFVVTDQQEQVVRLRTNLAIEPGRLGLGLDTTPDEALAFLDGLVANGLRARMITGNILSGSLQVELVQVNTSPPAILGRDANGKGIIPTTRSEITDVATTAEGVLARINNLPVEEMMSSAISMMDSIELLAKDEDLRAVPSSVTALLDEARSLLGDEDIQAVPTDLRAAISEMRQTIAELNTFVAGANDAEIVQSLFNTIQAANVAATNIEKATRNLPAITSRIELLMDKFFALEIESMVNAATKTIQAIDILISSDETASVPGSLSAALNEVRLFLAKIRSGNAIENVNMALASASAAAQSVEASVEGLPELSASASRLMSETEAVIQSYGDRSRFSAETLSTLRNIQLAADAVTNLARTIQRDPSSLLTGR